jgi:hypothetical protein
MRSLMARTIEVAGTPGAWEQRCQELLNRRPFRVIGWDEGGPEGREFVVEYRNVIGVVLALVYLDVMPSGAEDTTLSLRADAVADNPFRALFRDMDSRAIEKAAHRLTEGR